MLPLSLALPTHPPRNRTKGHAISRGGCADSSVTAFAAACFNRRRIQRGCGRHSGGHHRHCEISRGHRNVCYCPDGRRCRAQRCCEHCLSHHDSHSRQDGATAVKSGRRRGCVRTAAAVPRGLVVQSWLRTTSVDKLSQSRCVNHQILNLPAHCTVSKLIRCKVDNNRGGLVRVALSRDKAAKCHDF